MGRVGTLEFVWRRHCSEYHIKTPTAGVIPAGGPYAPSVGIRVLAMPAERNSGIITLASSRKRSDLLPAHILVRDCIIMVGEGYTLFSSSVGDRMAHL